MEMITSIVSTDPLYAPKKENKIHLRKLNLLSPSVCGLWSSNMYVSSEQITFRFSPHPIISLLISSKRVKIALN